MTVKITMANMKDGSEKIKVESPFHPEFPKHAKNLGGRWNSSARAWYFDPRDEASVRDLCRDCFGTDGNGELETVDCRVTLVGTQSDSVWFAGREICRRAARDWDVKLGDGVVVVDGDFQSSGGSRKYPQVTFTGDSVTLEVRDVPANLAKREAEDDPENVEILGALPVARVTVEVEESLLKPHRDSGMADAEIVAAALKAYHV